MSRSAGGPWSAGGGALSGTVVRMSDVCVVDCSSGDGPEDSFRLILCSCVG